jgi:hypothetical protein
MKKTQGKIISVSYLYMWYRFVLIYINFNFDFLGLDNVYIRYNTAAHVVNSTKITVEDVLERCIYSIYSNTCFQGCQQMFNP